MQITISAPSTPMMDASEHAVVTVTQSVANAAGGRDNQVVSSDALLPGATVTLNLPAGQMVAVAVYRADPTALPLPVSFPPAQNPTA